MSNNLCNYIHTNSECKFALKANSSEVFQVFTALDCVTYNTWQFSSFYFELFSLNNYSCCSWVAGGMPGTRLPQKQGPVYHSSFGEGLRSGPPWSQVCGTTIVVVIACMWCKHCKHDMCVTTYRFLDKDRYMASDMQAVTRMLQEGKVNKRVMVFSFVLLFYCFLLFRFGKQLSPTCEIKMCLLPT